jgi:hypothetical protein
MQLAQIGLAALVVLNLAYLITSWRRGTNQATSDAATAWKGEAEALQVRVERLEAELRFERESKAELSGRVAELSAQNANLAGLVVGETVPKPIADALTGIANDIRAQVSETEDHLATGILAMTEAVTKVIGELRDVVAELRLPQ